MNLLLNIVAASGFVVVLWRCLRAAGRAASRGVDAFLAREMAETRAQRGDLTGMAEARETVAKARRSRTSALARVAFWLALLALPPLLLPEPALAYALYFLVWLATRGVERGRTNVAARH